MLRSFHWEFFLESPAAYGVAGAWLALALAGWWRPEPSWVDRLGRALGLGWLFANLIIHSGPFIVVG
jgi:hypothetical protein